uniref:Uncharacterized protein n=1 Tax=Panagrolaimus sp. PS1159 TaxID=55785 RepID=A0AC35GE80_9BILA
MAVINPCHRIQDYIDDDPGIDMIFYERYFNHEFAAGSFIIRNTNYSISVLRYWSEYFFRLPKSFHGTDNGAIHQVFMDLSFNETSKQKQCYDLWEISENYEDLFTFQACTKDALSKISPFTIKNKIKIIQKMSPGWVRDGWITNTLWSSEDFMLHGFKEAEISIGKWAFPFLDKFNMSKCHYGDASFPNFKYVKDYVATEERVRNLLGLETLKVHTNYVNYLRKIQLIRYVQSKDENKVNPFL